MSQTAEFLETTDGVTAAKGFSAGAVYATLKTPGDDTYDLGMLYSDVPCTVAGAFTRNSIVSPSVTVCKEVVARGTARALIANSGCANTSVGAQGMTDAREMARMAAIHARWQMDVPIEPEDVLVASTGVIGVELPIGAIRQHIQDIKFARGRGGNQFAKSIMTTDTHEKEFAVSYVDSNNVRITVGGCAKGSGMIHPNMATMLAFITTDAKVEQRFLQTVTKAIVGFTFNQIDVDGDQSTNDTVLVLANGLSTAAEISGGGADSRLFVEALSRVCRHLARELARDGEGARQLITGVVDGAKSTEDAQLAARSIVSSLLVRTAVYGRDPNWGRIMMAVGKTGIELDESKIQIFINGIQIVEDGKAVAFTPGSVIGALGRDEVELKVNLNIGDGRGEAWGCDLTEDYVVINSAYTT